MATYGNSEGDNARKDVGASTSSLPADRATPIVSKEIQCISFSAEADVRGAVSQPNANGFAVYLGVFEDTRQIINKITHRGRALDITGVARCAHSTDIDGDDPVVVLQGKK